MAKAIFNKTGGPLMAKAIFLGDMIADYNMFLRDSSGTSQTLILHGDNLSPADDQTQLSTPCIINDKKIVKLLTLFFGNHPQTNKDYEIRLEIWQDGEIIGEDVDASTPEHKLNGKAQPSLLLITLIAE